MAVKSKIKKGDRVIVRTGEYRGTVGEVLKLMPKESRALVKGVNIRVHHQKQTPEQEGGRIRKESSIHLSNIALIDPQSNEPTRVGYKVEDGAKVRIARRSGDVIDG